MSNAVEARNKHLHSLRSSPWRLRSSRPPALPKPMMVSRKLQREVYLTCRTLFADQNALLRRPKKIREALQSGNFAVHHLVDQHGLDIVADVAKILLEMRIFESNLRAQIEFPELYETSAARGVQQTASLNDAAISEAEALTEVHSPLCEPAQKHVQCDLVEGDPGTQTAVPHRSHTLFPAYISYATQHRILTATQALLEQTCFEFAQKWLPEILETKKWDCAEAGELIQWTKILAKHRHMFPAEAINTEGSKLIESLVVPSDSLRHAAVHRLPTTAASVFEMVASAATLARALKDNARGAQIEQAARELESAVRDMEGNKEFLKSRLDQELKAIDNERFELDEKEKRVIAAMIEADSKYQAESSSLLDQRLAAVLRKFDNDPALTTRQSVQASTHMHQSSTKRKAEDDASPGRDVICTRVCDDDSDDSN